MATVAAIHAALVTLIDGFTAPAGMPTWRRSTTPAMFMRQTASPTHGAWGLLWPTVTPTDGSQRASAYVRAEFGILASYQLSPQAGRGATTEEESVEELADALRQHVFAHGSGVNTAGAHLIYTGESREAGLPGWLWLTIRGDARFPITFT